MPDMWRPRPGGNRDKVGVHSAPHVGFLEVPTDCPVAGESEIGDGGRSGVPPAQHVGFGQSVEPGRVVEVAGTPQHRLGPGRERPRAVSLHEPVQ